MKEIRKLLKLPKTSYYETHLSIVNCVLPVKLTPMEIKVLASFMALEGDIAQYRFGPSAKKIVMEQCGISAAGLTNYIGPRGSLTTKGFLVRTGDVVNILPLLIPEEKEQTYLFKLQNIDDGRTT